MSSFNILVVDDATMIRDLIKKFVRDYFPQAKIFDANNGQSGKSLLQQKSIDLLLCDWEMPEMNGMELLDWVRNSDTYKNLPFIMVTSRGDKQYVVEAIKAGVSDYLVKPFNRQQFAEKVGKALQRHGIQGRMAEPQKMASGSLEVLTNRPAKATPKKPLPKGAALLRTADGEVKCAVKQLDGDYCAGVFKHKDYLPPLLAQVSLDIEFQDEGEQKVMRINGFIEQLKVVDHRAEQALVEVRVHFMDEDPAKQQSIADYVAQFR